MPIAITKTESLVVDTSLRNTGTGGGEKYLYIDMVKFSLIMIHFSLMFDTVNLCVLIYVTGLRISQSLNLIHIFTYIGVSLNQ
jgi:hypothetical protein